MLLFDIPVFRRGHTGPAFERTGEGARLGEAKKISCFNDRSTRLSPLGWASFGNQVETARELIERGARMDDGELLCAASVGHVEVGRLLIQHGADPNVVSEEAGGNAKTVI